MTGEIIAIEEHFWDTAFASHFTSPGPARSPELIARMEDFGAVRLADMDEAGIDIQVISHAPPAGQQLDAETGPAACRAVNDVLARAIATSPDRFAGFAALATVEPEGAADELQRSVEELGFKGAMLHGLSNGHFLDEPAFRPVFARAERLGVPIYLHPGFPHPAVIKAYYSTYAESHPSLLRAAWGFGVETATQAIRLVLSGIFRDHPDLKIILGHLGEGLPFQLDRIDEALSRPGNEVSDFMHVFKQNFYLTTSGAFSDVALRCSIDALSVDRILFAVDWPFVPNKTAVDWIKAFDLDAEAKEQICSGNARRLLRMS